MAPFVEGNPLSYTYRCVDVQFLVGVHGDQDGSGVCLMLSLRKNSAHEDKQENIW
jgi:hypothetical protein